MALKTSLTIVGILAVVAAAFYFMPTQPASNSGLKQTTVTIGATTVVVEVADTESSREQGLSGRASLAEGHGMLFVFQQEAKDGFWMKDMNFPIDMLFADAEGKIVSIYPNLSPSSYNSADPNKSQIFYPTAPALYVLEVPAGFAAAHSIDIGVQMMIQ